MHDFWIVALYGALVLGVLVFVHELGHFLVAKWLGVRVLSFSIGMGPRLFGFRKGGTDYRVSLLPLGGFDSSCPAMAQGPTRRARGEAFAKYVNEKYGAHHKLATVALCGHNARCMFTADPVLTLIFPTP